MEVPMGLQLVARLRGTGEPMLEPLLREILNEHFRQRYTSEIVPRFWSHFQENMSEAAALAGFLAAVTELQTSVEATSCTAAIVGSLPSAQPGGSLTTADLLASLRISLAASQPPFLPTLVAKVVSHSMEAQQEASHGTEEAQQEAGHGEEEAMDEGSPSSGDRMEEGERGGGGGLSSYWQGFTRLVSQLKSLQLLEFFVDHAVAEAVQSKVKVHVSERCSQEFDSSLLEEVISSVQEVVLGWLGCVYGNSEEVRLQWLPQLEYFSYKTFTELRISELFNILVEYPDSEPALHDLRACLSRVDCRAHLITSLRNTYKQRLLQPGANTADIITQYISSIKGLHLLDPSGVVLEQVCDPVRAYLRTREDTVRCIVASLTDDSSNELADELVTGEPVLVDLSDESEGEDQDFDTWLPDPVDADPSKTSKSRQTSDIISLLVNIYGSREMFVNEYRNLLADRLLQSADYDTAREVRNLELLKLRFGEANLHFCEVMIKDMADSRRINSHVISQQRKELPSEAGESDEHGEMELNGFILSHVFWPAFREEKLNLPDFIQRRLERYLQGFQSLKGMRTLEWKPHLGTVQVELQLSDRELSLSVSPIRATIIYHFQEQSTWTVDSLSGVLEAQPSVVRRHLGFWVGQGVLKESPTDTFTVVEEQQEGARPTHADVEDEEESAMATAEEQKESELQVFWSYIVGMLTNLGKLPLKRIHTMLRMFAVQGVGQECSPAELRVFLDRKVREQQLLFSGGTYQLTKAGQ